MIIDFNPLQAIIILDCYNLGVLDYLEIEGILRFSLLIKDREEIIRVHHQIENIFDQIRLCNYSRHPQN